MFLDEDLEEYMDETVEISKSSIEEENRNQINCRYQYEQDLKILVMEKVMKAFEVELKELIRQKEHLSVILKYSEICCISLYEEMQLIRATENQEECLINKVNEAKLSLNTTRNQVHIKYFNFINHYNKDF